MWSGDTPGDQHLTAAIQPSSWSRRKWRWKHAICRHLATSASYIYKETIYYLLRISTLPSFLYFKTLTYPIGTMCLRVWISDISRLLWCMKEPGQGPATLLAGRHRWRCGRGSWRLVLVAHLFWLAARAWRLAGNTYHCCFICGHVAHVPRELLFIHLPWLLHLIHVPSSLVYWSFSTQLACFLSICLKDTGGINQVSYHVHAMIVEKLQILFIYQSCTSVLNWDFPQQKLIVFWSCSCNWMVNVQQYPSRYTGGCLPLCPHKSHKCDWH